MRGPLRRVNEATDAGWRCTSIAASTTMAANWSARTPGSCIRLPWRVSWRPWRLGGSPLPSALSGAYCVKRRTFFVAAGPGPEVTAMSHELLVRHTSWGVWGGVKTPPKTWVVWTLTVALALLSCENVEKCASLESWLTWVGLLGRNAPCAT
jgi:hypothetical protein